MIRLSGALTLFLLCAAALALYQLKYEVAELEAEHAVLTKELAAEREAVHVLEAEWAFLERPERLAKLASAHLDLVPLGADKIMRISDLPWAATILAGVGEGER